MKNKCAVFLAVTVFAGSQLPAEAWNATGHMTVAEIARERLTPTAQARCTELLAVNALPMEARNPAGMFIAAACWADDIKSPADAELHFISLPFTTDGTTPRLPRTHTNIVDGIMECVTVLENPRALKMERAVKLRYLLNLIGDIHQPLHCATRCNEQTPHGDKNGHQFSLADGTNLRAFWDNGAGLLKAVVARPLTVDGLAKIAHLQQLITTACPADSLEEELGEKSPRKWAEESLEVAKSAAYGISPQEAPSKEYVFQAQEAVKRRLALAGYRLGNLLNNLFDRK